MTHEYTVLIGGVVLTGGDGPAAATAIAWAADTILAIGDDEAVRSISRGNSRFVDLGGACVVPAEGRARDRRSGGPRRARGRSASGREGRRPGTPRKLAVVRGGEVVEGTLPAGIAALTDHAP